MLWYFEHSGKLVNSSANSIDDRTLTIVSEHPKNEYFSIPSMPNCFGFYRTRKERIVQENIGKEV